MQCLQFHSIYWWLSRAQFWLLQGQDPLWLMLSYLDIHLTDATTELKTWYGRFFGAYWVQKFSAPCVKRYRVILRTWEGEKSCTQKKFWTLSMLKFSQCFNGYGYTTTLCCHEVDFSGEICNWMTTQILQPHHQISHGENILSKE